MFNISICIPCIYLHVEHLENCIKSFIKQTVLPLEVNISISEITKEEEKRIVNKLSKLTQNIFELKIVSSEKKINPGGNRKRAFDISNGDIICLFDADDIPHIQFVEFMEYIYDKHNPNLFLYNYQQIHNIKCSSCNNCLEGRYKIENKKMSMTENIDFSDIYITDKFKSDDSKKGFTTYDLPPEFYDSYSNKYGMCAGNVAFTKDSLKNINFFENITKSIEDQLFCKQFYTNKKKIIYADVKLMEHNVECFYFGSLDHFGISF